MNFWDIINDSSFLVVGTLHGRIEDRKTKIHRGDDSVRGTGGASAEWC